MHNSPQVVFKNTRSIKREITELRTTHQRRQGKQFQDGAEICFVTLVKSSEISCNFERTMSPSALASIFSRTTGSVLGLRKT